MCKKIFSVIVASCAVLISSASLRAQETQPDSPVNNNRSVNTDDIIIITGRRYESSVLKEGKTVTVITEDEIKASGKDDLSQVLETVPGVTITRQGTDSSNINIYIRGSKSGNVLILVDGVKINDPSDISSSVDLSLIRTYNIERIEIVEGSMSSLYGAEASGGVINVITKKAKGKYVSLRLDGGTYHTFTQSISAGETGDKSSFFFSGSHYSSGGISSAKDLAGAGGFDDDNTDYYNASCKMTGEFRDKMTLMFTMNYTDKKMDLDYDSGIDDDNYSGSGRMFTAAADFIHSPFTWWNYRAGGSFVSLGRFYNNGDNPSSTGPNAGENWYTTYSGSGINGHLLNHFTVPGAGTISVGAEVLHENADTSSAYYDSASTYTSFSMINDKSVTTVSVFLHDALTINDMIFLNAGARLDNHSEFGNYYTWDLSGAFILPVTGTKLRGSAGAGFKAPSLYQLYSTGYVKGNPDLKPEKSFTCDTGVYQELAMSANIITFEGTLFYQKYTDMIDSVSSQYVNIGGEMADRGFEVAASYRFSDKLFLRYSYTYLDFLEDYKEQPFWKRPSQKHSFIATLTPLKGLSITASWLYVGSRDDYYYDYGTGLTTDMKLDPYHKIDANIRYAFNETLTVTARGENLTDADYMDTYGYNTYGRSFFGGVELTF